MSSVDNAQGVGIWQNMRYSTAQVSHMEWLFGPLQLERLGKIFQFDLILFI